MPTQLLSPRRIGGGAAVGSIAIAMIIGLSGCSAIQSLLPDSETRDEETGEITEGGTTDVFTLSVGDCLNDESLASVEGDESTEVTEVPTVPCDEPHDFEVYQNFTVPEAAEYPGEEAVTASADAQCLPEFETFVGVAYEDSVLTASYYYPTEASWADGDRTINCLIIDEAGKTTGSLAGAAR